MGKIKEKKLCYLVFLVGMKGNSREVKGMFTSRASIGGLCLKGMRKGLEIWENLGDNSFSQQEFIECLLCASHYVNHTRHHQTHDS